MTLKERIENNLTLYTLGLLVTGFLAGLTTYKFILDIVGTKPQEQAECKTEIWQAAAQKAEWIPQAQCPAFPLELKLASPGNGSTIEVAANSKDWLPVPIVVGASRPLPRESNIGIIFKPVDSPNFYVVFPGFEATNSPNIYRRDIDTRIPFELKAGVLVELRALIVDDKRKIGQQFASIEQIKSADPSIFVSEPASLNISIK